MVGVWWLVVGGWRSVVGRRSSVGRRCCPPHLARAHGFATAAHGALAVAGAGHRALQAGAGRALHTAAEVPNRWEEEEMFLLARVLRDRVY